MFGIKLQLRSFSIKRCYSFRPIASYRDARGEETHAHMRLCCSQTPEDRVSRVEAHIIAVFMIRAIVNELHPTFFFVLFF